MREMSAKGLGASAMVDPDGRAIGIFTDGDLRRLIETGVDLRGLKARDVMHRGPAHHPPDALAVEAAELMETAPHHQRAGGRCRRQARAAPSTSTT